MDGTLGVRIASVFVTTFLGALQRHCRSAVWPLPKGLTRGLFLEGFLLFPWSVPALPRDVVPSWLPRAGLHGRLGTPFVT